MEECPTCKLSIGSHSTQDLIDCCMVQIQNDMDVEKNETYCPNCKHDLKKHSNHQLAECIIAFLRF